MRSTEHDCACAHSPNHKCKKDLPDYGDDREQNHPAQPPAQARKQRTAARKQRPVRSVFDYGLSAPISLPQDPTPRRDQHNKAKPGERNGHGRKPLEHNCGYGRIEEIDRESDRHLPEHRAHLSSTDIPEDLVGGRAFQYGKPASPVSRVEEECGRECRTGAQGREAPRFS